MRVIPVVLDEYSYDLFIILEDDNIERIKSYDPGEVVTASLPDAFTKRKVRNIMLTYAKPEEIPIISEMCQAGQLRRALRFLTRGWKFRPNRGDNDEKYEAEE